MRKLTLRDILATLVVAAVVVPFIGYSVRGSMPFVHDPRGMAGVGIAGCLLTFAVLGRDALGTAGPTGHCRAVWSAAGHSQPEPLPGDCGTPGLLFRAGTRKLLKGWR